jgi:hypothetical protein
VARRSRSLDQEQDLLREQVLLQFTGARWCVAPTVAYDNLLQKCRKKPLFPAQFGTSAL